MSKLKIITSIQMCKLVESLGFVAIRQKGSHRFYRHDDGRTTIIPMHVGDLDRSLVRKMLRDMEITIDEFNDIV
jgi:predicted RNA binding protein YcfA (HicA-like mRNA interferase family)